MASPALADERWRRQASVASSSASMSTTPSPSSTTLPKPTNGFYNNQLFYILIAVLGAFAIVSSGNLIRSRRRRRIVIREATRLGLMVPGMPGYVPMRERPAFVKADGWRTPDWWEVEPEKQSEEVESGASDAVALGQTPGPSLSQTTAPENEYGARGQLELPDLDDLQPLALIPEPVVVNIPQKPWSAIPYFPNYVSYLRSTLEPREPRFAPENPQAFECIKGEEVQVVVALRMPTRDRPRPTTTTSEEEDDAVIMEWSGLELGVANFTVQKE